MRIYFLLLILSFSCSSHTHKPSEELKNVKNHMRNESIYDESYAALSNYDGEMNKAFTDGNLVLKVKSVIIFILLDRVSPPAMTEKIWIASF